MTPIEARDAVIALRRRVGPKADAMVSLNTDSYSTNLLSLALWPDGYGRPLAFRIEADTFDELIKLANQAWEERQVEYHAKITRAMALEIIRLTADHGECTDAALRATYSVEDVARYGKEAIEDANKIASNGPFSIAILRGANAA